MSSTENQSKLSTGKGGKREGAGRPKGAVDKGNALIREMIVEALHGLGGIEYLQGVARSHPTAFVSLIGKTMPLQVTGDGGGPVKQSLEVVFRSAN
jgi:hypothetical protein